MEHIQYWEAEELQDQLIHFSKNYQYKLMRLHKILLQALSTQGIIFQKDQNELPDYYHSMQKGYIQIYSPADLAVRPY